MAGVSVLLATASSLALANTTQLVNFGQEMPVSFGASKVSGAVAGSTPINIGVSLRPSDGAGFEAYVHSVSDPKSPSYRHFLTPSQVGALFGASLSTVEATVNYLQSQGFKVTLVADNRLLVAAEGTVAQAERAFDVKIATLAGPSPDGSGTYTYRSYLSAPKVPLNLSKAVLNIEGMDTGSRPKPMNTQTLTPALHKGLYDLNPIFNNGHQGLGRKVGVTNWGDGYKLSNIPLFYSYFGLPVPNGGMGSNVHTVLYSGGSAGHSALGECDLDMQLELGQAPLADLYLYDDGSSGGNHVTMLGREGTDNLCDLISESWGWSGVTGTTASSLHNQYLAMAAQGITYLCASGDSGTKDTYDYPDFDPAVLVVGGTVATVNSNTGARVSEVGWSGSGGGYSNKTVSFNVLPSWQVGNGIPTNLNYRLFPDVSGHAAGSGGAYYFFYSGGLNSANGTSLSSPSCAGSLAICEERLIAAGALPPDGNGKQRLGHVHELIYGMNGRNDVFYDVLSGSNGSLYNGQSSTCHAGWDTVTGWGCFDYNGFCNAVISGSGSETDFPTAYTVSLGRETSGDVSSLKGIDGNALNVCKFLVPSQQSPFVQVVFTGATSYSSLSSQYHIAVHAAMNAAGVFAITLEGYNFATSSYDVSSTSTIGLSYADFTLDGSGTIDNYRGPGGALQARIKVKQNGPTASVFPCVLFDQVAWTVK